MGSALPVRRSTPLGSSIVELPVGRSLRATLHALSRPFRGRHPRVGSTRPRSRGLRHAPGSELRFLSWTLSALRHGVSAVVPRHDDGSLRRRVPRARFGYLLRGVHHWALRPPAPFGTARLPARQARWSAHGLHSSRGSPRPRWVLLSESLPSCRCRQLPPRHPEVWSFSRQSPSGPCSRGESVQHRGVQGQAPVGSGRRSRLEVPFLSRACSRSTWPALWSRSLPSHPWMG